MLRKSIFPTEGKIHPPNGKGLGFTEEAAGPKHCQNHWRHLLAFLPTHTKTRALPRGQQGRFQKKPLEQFYVSHLLKAHSKNHHRKSCSSRLISNCGCMASVCCVEEVLASQIQSLQFIFFPRTLSWAGWCTPEHTHRFCTATVAFLEKQNPSQRWKWPKKTSKTTHYHCLSASLWGTIKSKKDKRNECHPETPFPEAKSVASGICQRFFQQKPTCFPQAAWWMQLCQVSVKQLL